MGMQVDLDMLNVSLGTGTLEIRSALLNTDYLTQQLVSQPGAAVRMPMCLMRKGLLRCTIGACWWRVLL